VTTIVDFGAGHPRWELLHPRFSADMLGPYLPFFLRVDDTRKAAEQFDSAYRFGGWQSFGKGFELRKDNSLKYPGDPPQPPLAQCKLGDELVVLYPSDFVAVIQPDRSFDVARLD
jgi:hypothetical protein